jgi:guanylate kinase
LARAEEFDTVIINANLEQAVGELERLIQQRFPAR